MRALHVVTLLAIASSMMPSQAAAQAGTEGARPSLTAVRTMQPPAIDGRLDDAVAGTVFDREGDELYVDLEPWGFHVLTAGAAVPAPA